jgi:hypothetical protein
MTHVAFVAGRSETNLVSPEPIRVFFSYARPDVNHLDTLRRFAARLTADKSVRFFDDRDIPSGRPWQETLFAELDTADVVVLLLTANFLASEFIMDVELSRAMRRHDQGSCVLVPLNVAPFLPAEFDQLARLQWFPSAPSITGRDRVDEAWVDAARELRRKIDDYRTGRSPDKPRTDAHPDTGRGPVLGQAMRSATIQQAIDQLSGGSDRRISRAARALERAFAAAPANEIDDRAARVYGRSIRLALRLRHEAALEWISRYDARIPDRRYAVAFQPSDAGWLRAVAEHADQNTIEAVFEVAARLDLMDVQRFIRDRLIRILAAEPDPTALIGWLRRWHHLGLLDRDAMADAIGSHLADTALTRNRTAWTELFTDLPDAGLPDLFEVHCLLGRCARAARLADTPTREAEVLACALASTYRTCWPC